MVAGGVRLWDAGGLTETDAELDFMGHSGSLGLRWPVRVVPNWAGWLELHMPSSISHQQWATSEGVASCEVQLRHSLEEVRVGGGQRVAGVTGPSSKGIWAEHLSVYHSALGLWD